MLAVASNVSSAGAWQSAACPNESFQTNLSGACALLSILVQTQSVSQAGAKTDIELGAQKLEELKKQLADAIHHAEEAADQSGFFGFLGDIFGSDIAQIAGAVASIAATVATGGAAAPLLLITLSAALQAGAKLGAELGLAPELCVALSLASVAVGLCSGVGSVQAAGALADGARKVELVANVVQGGATATGGVLHGISGKYHAQQLDRQADATRYQAEHGAVDLTLQDSFALLQNALRTQQRETSTVSAIIQNNSDANSALSNRI